MPAPEEAPGSCSCPDPSTEQQPQPLANLAWRDPVLLSHARPESIHPFPPSVRNLRERMPGSSPRRPLPASEGCCQGDGRRRDAGIREGSRGGLGKERAQGWSRWRGPPAPEDARAAGSRPAPRDGKPSGPLALERKLVRRLLACLLACLRVDPGRLLPQRTPGSEMEGGEGEEGRQPVRLGSE